MCKKKSMELYNNVSCGQIEKKEIRNRANDVIMCVRCECLFVLFCTQIQNKNL